MGACWHASQVYVRVEETGNKRGRETNDRKIQPGRTDKERTIPMNELEKTKKDERLVRSPEVTIRPTGQKSHRMFVKYRVFHE